MKTVDLLDGFLCNFLYNLYITVIYTGLQVRRQRSNGGLSTSWAWTLHTYLLLDFFFIQTAYKLD